MSIHTKLINEIFSLASAIEDVKERAAFLKTQSKYNPAVVQLIAMNYDPTFAVEGLDQGYPTNFKMDDSPAGLSISTLAAETKRLAKLRTDIPKANKELFLLHMLELLHAPEAEILVFVKDRALEEIYPMISREVAKEAGWLDN